MNWSMALNIGEAFAEVVLVRGTEQRSHRWFLPGLQFPKVLNEWLKAEDIGVLDSVRISVDWINTIIHRKLGHLCALIVTTGFENLLELNGLTSIPISRDHILGLSERTLALGEILIEPSTEDLEFLVAKLELLKIRHVAVGLLHSDKNAANQNKVKTFFEAHGLKVYTSETHGSEKERWNEALLNASCTELYEQWLEAIITTLEPYVTLETPIEILTENGFISARQKHSAVSTRSGLKNSLKRFFKSQPFTYFGLEQFFDFTDEDLPLQPLNTLRTGFFGVVEFHTKSVQYEVGPMGFGRGQNVTVLDIAWQELQMSEPAELLQKFSDKSRKRINEALLALSRPLLNEERTSAFNLLEILKSEMRYAFADLKGHQMSGPLAKTFAPLMPHPSHLIKQGLGFEASLGLLKERDE